MSRLDQIRMQVILGDTLQSGSVVQVRLDEEAKHQLKGLMLDIIGSHRPNCAVNTPGLSQLTMDNVKRGRQEVCDCGILEMGRRVSLL